MDALLLLATNRSSSTSSPWQRIDSTQRVSAPPSSVGTASPVLESSAELSSVENDEDSLVAARKEQRIKEARELLRNVTEVVYRPAQEGPHRPSDLERVVVLAVMKATRELVSS